MLIPIGDDDRRLHKPSYVTTGLLVANVVVFALFQGFSGDSAFTYAWSVIPYEITTGIDLSEPIRYTVDGQRFVIPHQEGPPFLWLTILTAMFMHGSVSHLLGNLLYLWIFGDNVEHRFGHRVFFSFYLVSGIAATVTQIVLSPESPIPNLGASGAISGVLGAYLVLFPRNKVHALLFFWILSIPAVVAIGAWFAFQLMSGWSALLMPDEMAGGVAYGAHVGGFVAGVVLAVVLRLFIREERPGLYAVSSGVVNR